MKYDLEYFITKFSAIPECDWTEGNLEDQDNPECKCALGHCSVKKHRQDSRGRSYCSN